MWYFNKVATSYISTFKIDDLATRVAPSHPHTHKHNTQHTHISANVHDTSMMSETHTHLYIYKYGGTRYTHTCKHVQILLLHYTHTLTAWGHGPYCGPWNSNVAHGAPASWGARSARAISRFRIMPTMQSWNPAGARRPEEIGSFAALAGKF